MLDVHEVGRVPGTQSKDLLIVIEGTLQFSICTDYEAQPWLVFRAVGPGRPTSPGWVSPKIMAIFFVLLPSGEFGAHELREGPPLLMDANNNAFTVAFKKYLDKRRLTDLVGLQVLDNNKRKPQQEFVFQ